jgi:hypothetical protein
MKVTMQPRSPGKAKSPKRIQLGSSVHLVYTIEYIVGQEDANLEECLDKLREYGSAEIVKTEIQV